MLVSANLRKGVRGLKAECNNNRDFVATEPDTRLWSAAAAAAEGSANPAKGSAAELRQLFLCGAAERNKIIGFVAFGVHIWVCRPDCSVSS